MAKLSLTKINSILKNDMLSIQIRELPAACLAETEGEGGS